MLWALMTLLAAALQSPHHVSLMQLRQGASQGFGEARRLTENALPEGPEAIHDPQGLELVAAGGGQAVSCPETCKCSSSGGPDGLAVNAEGYCVAACSQVYNFGHVQKRFCGDGEHYRLGDFEDCSGCAASGETASTTTASSAEETSQATTPAYPDCVQADTWLRTTWTPQGYENSLLFDATAFGKGGECTDGDCANTDKFTATRGLGGPDMDECAETCAAVEGCKFWTYNAESDYPPNKRVCLLRTSDSGADHSTNAQGAKSASVSCAPTPTTATSSAPKFQQFMGKCRGGAPRSSAGGEKTKRYSKNGVDQNSCQLLCAMDWCQAYAVGNGNCYLYPASPETDPGAPDDGWAASGEDIVGITKGNKNVDWKCMKMKPHVFEEFPGKCRDSKGDTSRRYMNTDMDRASCQLLCAESWCQAYAFQSTNGKCNLYPASAETDPGMPDGDGWVTNYKSNDDEIPVSKITQGNAADGWKCMKRVEFEPFTGKCRDANDDKSKKYYKSNVDTGTCETLCAKEWCQAFAVGGDNGKCILYPASAETDPGEPAIGQSYFELVPGDEDDDYSWGENSQDYKQIAKGNEDEDYHCMKRL